MSRQTTDTILMVRPANFGFNEQTAESNAFQNNDTSLSPEDIQSNALKEFDAVVKILREADIQVIIAEDTPKPIKPDAIFPNNWVTFHSNGTIILYPMLSENRRKERQEYILNPIMHDFVQHRRIDFSDMEDKNIFLEGTGSMILDRQNHIVYACISPRTNPKLLDEFCRWAEYTKIEFYSEDSNNQQIYHTNVMMALGETFVIICLDSINDANERKKIIAKMEETNKEIIEINMKQMLSFAGNMLQVRNSEDETYLLMSNQAHNSLSEEQLSKIKTHTNILTAAIPTIEKHGGGSVRCMMAEVFLPRKN